MRTGIPFLRSVKAATSPAGPAPTWGLLSAESFVSSWEWYFLLSAPGPASQATFGPSVRKRKTDEMLSLYILPIAFERLGPPPETRWGWCCSLDTVDR